tara:strand:+ start:86 stop:349 length:264 start_codon:yes stop_codon:yes gene_type:complete
MPTYPVVNRVTGEQKDVRVPITEWDQWKVDNPDWDRDWSDPSTCPNSGEVGDWRDKMRKTHPGFHDIMRNKIAPKAPTNDSITQKYN